MSKKSSHINSPIISIDYAPNLWKTITHNCEKSSPEKPSITWVNLAASDAVSPHLTPSWRGAARTSGAAGIQRRHCVPLGGIRCAARRQAALPPLSGTAACRLPRYEGSDSRVPPCPATRPVTLSSPHALISLVGLNRVDNDLQGQGLEGRRSG